MANNSLFNFLPKDIAIDLGTANTLVYVRSRGIVITEPSVVAFNEKTGQVLAIGQPAKKMIGKTPSHIIASRPVLNGVISDFEVTEQMLRYFIDKVNARNFIPFHRPFVIISVPVGATEVERRAVEEAARSAGARGALVVEEPVAAAIGTRLPIEEASGNMIIDIGGGTTEIAVISLGGIVTAQSIKVAGDKFDQDIIDYARDNFKIIIGQSAAEEAKINLASALKSKKDEKEMRLRGRDALTGLPKEVAISSEQIYEALKGSFYLITEAVGNVLEETPPELVADIMKKGAILCGGGSQIKKLDRFIKKETGLTVRVAEDPITAVVRGLGMVLEDRKHYQKFFNQEI